MHRNENSWPKPKTEKEETKAENRNTERIISIIAFMAMTVYKLY